MTYAHNADLSSPCYWDEDAGRCVTSETEVCDPSLELAEDVQSQPIEQDACDSQPVCGNGVLECGEECDDGNDASGDGCSDACVVEEGYLCDTSLYPNACSPDNNSFEEWQ